MEPSLRTNSSAVAFLASACANGNSLKPEQESSEIWIMLEREIWGSRARVPTPTGLHTGNVGTGQPTDSLTLRPCVSAGSEGAVRLLLQGRLLLI